MPIYREVNRDFFKKWTPEMAYVLGFFTADGSMIRNKRGAHFIEFQIADKDILVAIQKALKSTHKIAIREQRNAKWKSLYRLQIGSKIIFEDLQKLGFTPAKSKTISFPSMPSKYLADFIRGYFDGDGNVYFKKHKTKDRKNPRWCFSSRLTSGSKSFLLALQKKLRLYTKGGFVIEKKKGYELVFSHHDSLALFRLMYNNIQDKLFLERKHKLFRRAITTLYGPVV